MSKQFGSLRVGFSSGHKIQNYNTSLYTLVAKLPFPMSRRRHLKFPHVLGPDLLTIKQICSQNTL
jgi:hypothetical protein